MISFLTRKRGWVNNAGEMERKRKLPVCRHHKIKSWNVKTFCATRINIGVGGSKRTKKKENMKKKKTCWKRPQREILFDIKKTKKPMFSKNYSNIFFNRSIKMHQHSTECLQHVRRRICITPPTHKNTTKINNIEQLTCVQSSINIFLSFFKN